MNILGQARFTSRATITAGAFALALSLFATSGNAEYASEDMGGSGGSAFRSPCRPNDVLVGVHLRIGTALDAITAICSPLNGSGTDWAGETYQPTQTWGGGGGVPKTLRCKRGDAVHRMTIQEGPWDELIIVKGVGISCGDLDAAYFYDVVQGAQSTVSNSGAVKCKDGDWATGVVGGSGNFVDRVGLVCNHIGASATTTTTTPSSVETPPPGGQADGIDLFGNDIAKLVARNEGVCAQACRANDNCRAWTFVRNGSMCFLKNPVPPAVKSECCVSGLRRQVKDMGKKPKPADAGGGGAMTCTILQPVDVCPTTDGCDEGTRIGVLTQGTVTLLGREGPWHKVRVPAGEGFAFSGEGFVSLDCPQ